MNNTNNYSARQSYLHAIEMFYRAFRDKFPPGAEGDMRCKSFVESLKLSQSELRMEVVLNAVNSSFAFGVVINQSSTGGNTPFITERRLNLQDSLCINEYAITVAFPSGASSTAFQQKTYGNTQTFTGAGVAAALDSTFYSNGQFQIKCNNDVICPGRGLYNHWYKGQTQQTAALGANSPADMIRGAEDGFITMEPNVVLIGSKNYVPSIELPSAMSGTFTTERAILTVRGILAQNSTVVS